MFIIRVEESILDFRKFGEWLSHLEDVRSMDGLSVMVTNVTHMNVGL
jgi:hypothetical protein